MDRFISIIAEGDWAASAKVCADRLTGLGEPPAGNAYIGFLYVTDPLAGDLGSIVTYLRQKTAVVHWVGAVGSGIAADGQEIHRDPALGALVACFPADSFRIVNGYGGAASLTPAVGEWTAAVSPSFGIVHGNPGDAGVGDAVEDLALSASGDLGGGFLVGGLAAVPSEAAIVADGPVSGPVSGVLFGPGVEVATGLSQGCTPLGEAHIVGEASDNVVMTLDDRSALDVLKQDVGELLARDLARLAGYVHAAMPVTGSDTGDYMVRNLLAIDAERGWLGIGGEVGASDRLLFVRRDPESARIDLQRALNGLKARLPGPARGALYFSCVARGPSMFGLPGAEARMIQETLGPVPLAGFFGGGEISNARLYAYTGVLTLFC